MQKIIDTPSLKVYADCLSSRFAENNIMKYEDIFPKQIKLKISKYTILKDRKLRILGKILLMELLIDSGNANLSSLESLRYTSNNKPLMEGFYVSIAHSGEMALASLSSEGEIGVDIEEIKPVQLASYELYFTKEEFDYLKNTNEKNFYKLWTRKEALAKATGDGIFLPFGEINVLGNEVVLEYNKYHFEELELGSDYQGTVCFKS